MRLKKKMITLLLRDFRHTVWSMHIRLYLHLLYQLTVGFVKCCF